MKHHSRSHAHATDNTQVRACCATQPVKQERPESKQHATHGHSAKEHSCCSSAKAATASEATHTAVADATASIDPVCGMTVANDSPHSATRGGAVLRLLLGGLPREVRCEPGQVCAGVGPRLACEACAHEGERD